MVDYPFYNDIKHDMCIALSNKYEKFTQSASVVKFILIIDSKQVRLSLLQKYSCEENVIIVRFHV